MTGDLNMQYHSIKNVYGIYTQAMDLENYHLYIAPSEGLTHYIYTFKSGEFIPPGNNAQSLGGATNRWSKMYAVLGHFYGTLDMHSQKITNVLDPTANQEAATKKYVDDSDNLLLPLSGARAMTGDLDISTFALKTTNLQLKEHTSSSFAIRNAADDDFLGLSLLRMYLHTNDSIIRSGDSNLMTLYGGENHGAIIQLHGKNHATDPGEFEVQVPNAAKNDWVVAMDIKGATDTPIAHIYHGLNMHSKKITDVLDPTANQEAATKKYVDDNIGGFACSDLSSCSLANLGTKDHHLLTGLGDDDHTQYLLVSGTRAMTGDLDMGTHKILNVTNPTALQHAATKKYVDDNIFSCADIWDCPHDYLGGLGDDDHTQYLLVNGARAMTGDLELTGNRTVKATGELYLDASAGQEIWALKHFVPSGDDSHLLGATNFRWSDLYAVVVHEGDVAFAEKECIKCNNKFKVGDNIVYKVIMIDEETEEPMAIPIHLECANSPPKKVKKSYAVKEDYYIWDEEKGEATKRKRNKSVTKNAKKRKVKEGNFEFDDKKGEFWKLKKDDGEEGGMVRDKKVSVNDATEEVEEELKEIVYEDKEFLI